MERTVYTSNRLQINISMIPGLGFALTYENRYKEMVMILGCFLIAFEFKHTRKKRK